LGLKYPFFYPPRPSFLPILTLLFRLLLLATPQPRHSLQSCCSRARRLLICLYTAPLPTLARLLPSSGKQLGPTASQLASLRLKRSRHTSYSCSCQPKHTMLALSPLRARRASTSSPTRSVSQMQQQLLPTLDGSMTSRPLLETPLFPTRQRQNLQSTSGKWASSMRQCTPASAVGMQLISSCSASTHLSTTPLQSGMAGLLGLRGVRTSGSNYTRTFGSGITR